MAGKEKAGLRNVTYTTENATGDSSFFYGLCDKQPKEEDNDAPVVFQCGTCKLPIGDSLSWVGSEDDQNQILLRRTTDNVVVGNESFVSRTQVEFGCLIVNLTCRGCSSPLGRVYTSTPKSLDYKRALFCLSVASVDCYALGSSKQKALLDPNEEPVTLECKELMELQISQIKALAVSMGQRLFEIESQLQNDGK